MSLPQLHNWMQSDYVPHAPVNIESPENFSASGFTGSGTQADPYVLEGVSITTNGDCVRIINVDTYYVIRNCLLTSQAERSATGVYLDHAPHGSIESCIIDFKHNGVEFQSSDECMIVNNTIQDNAEHGVFLIFSNNCTLINNTIWGNDQEGVKTQGSVGCELTSNTIYEHGSAAICLIGSNSFRLTENILHHNSDGIVLEASSNCVLLNNSVHDNGVGIRVVPWMESQSNMNYLINNTIYDNNQYGIEVRECENITATSNEIYGNGEIGLLLYDSHNCEVTGNKINENPSGGVKLQGCSNCTLSNNTLGNNWIGVYLSESCDCTLSNNLLQNNGVSVSTADSWPGHFCHEFDNNSVNGRPLGYFWAEEDRVIDASSYGQVILGNCTNVTIQHGAFTNATTGITLGFCADCEVGNSSVSNCAAVGLHIIMSDNCSLLNNSIDDNSPFGVVLYESSLSTLSDNIMENNGVLIEGASSENWHHNFTNNTVNGKPLCYCWNESDTVLSGSLYGEVILAECNNATIRDGVFSNASSGVVMGFCTDCKVLNNSFHSNDGVYLSRSTGCSLYNNTMTDTLNGLRIVNSSHCHVYNNTISGTSGDDRYGIDLKDSANCTITGNFVVNGDYRGVFLEYSTNCTVSKNVIRNQSWEGVGLFRSQRCTAINNTILDCSGNGVFVKDSSDCTISRNIIHNNYNGVELQDSPGLILSDNIIRYNKDGVYLVSSCNTLLRNNIVHGNSWSGFYADFSHNTTFINNTAYDNNWAGIVLFYSDNCTLVDNSIHDSSDIGAIIDHSDHCLLSNNSVYACSGHGITVGFCFNITFVGNDIYSNVGHGILLDNFDNSSFTDGSIYNNSMHGAWISASRYSTLTGNVVIHNSASGIALHSDCSELTLYDNLIGWNDGGTAEDNGEYNAWDDDTSVGNAWGDYKGIGVYTIPGLAGAVDRYPSRADTTSPTIDHPSNIEYEAGLSGNAINWNPYDDHPESYLVFRNSEEIESWAWDGSPITVAIDGLSMSEYNFTLVVSDTCGNLVYDTVFVTVVDTTLPVMDHPPDIQYNVGTTGNRIVWNPFDYNPGSYEVLRDGTLVRSGAWDGSPISVDVDALAPGQYDFILIVTDLAGNSASDTVFVIVSAITPTTTTGDLGPSLTSLVAGGGIGAIVLLAVAFFVRRRTALRKLTPLAVRAEPAGPVVQALRGCEIIGGEFHYKVKVKNNTDYVVNKVTVNIISYPEDCLILGGDVARRITMIEPGGFRSPEFVFTPTKDCVEGHIQATVSYIDHENKLRTLETEPYVIRSVCDLLKPLESTMEEFDLILSDMAVAREQRTLDWNSEVLFRKVTALLPAKNFEIIDSKGDTLHGIFTGTISGLAEGKYTGMKVAVRIEISGNVDENKANVLIEGLGDDEAMLPTTIHEIAEGIQSWVCLNCGAALNPGEVRQLRNRVPVQCRYCGHTMSIDLYQKRST